MGWAARHMSEAERKELARALFDVTDETPDWLNGKCPLHADDNPSFGYNFVEDFFKCLANCTDSGDLVKLYALVRGLPNDQAFKELAGKYGDGNGKNGKRKGNGNVAGAARPHTPRQGGGPGRANGDSPAGGARGGSSPPKKNPSAPLSSYPSSSPSSSSSSSPFIPDDVWERMQPLPEAWLIELERERGWSRAVMRGLRMQTLMRDRYDNVIAIPDPQRVAIPVRDADGALRNIRLYKRPGSKVEKKIISWGRGFGSARLFPAKLGNKEGVVLLCEGEPDTLCALSQGFTALTQTSKTVRWAAEQRDVLRGRDVIICYDADQAGQTYAAQAAGELVQVAASVRILEWPDFMGRQEDGSWPADHGQDLTDFFVRHGKSARDLQELFTRARVIPKTEKTQDVGGFFVGRSFKPRLLADRILADQPLLHDDETGMIYRWNGKFWERIVRGQIMRLAAEYLGLEGSTSRINDAVNLALSLSTLPHGRRPNDRVEWVCLLNGMLNLRTLELRAHSQDDFCTFSLGVSFDPDKEARCQRWLRFLEANVQTWEPMEQLQEFAGYCLTREVRYEKCLLLLGDGSDGKSTFLSVLRAMVGVENTSAIAFQDLEDQFRRASLYGKLLNISTEVGSQAIETPVFKAVVSGDPIQAAFKHKDAFEFAPYCKLAFAANKLPRVLDNTDGFYRRMLPVRFKQQYLENDPARDPHLKEGLLEELSEIFQWALVGLHRLWANGRFTGCDETSDLLMDYRRLNNPVHAFVEDRCEVRESAWMDKGILYTAYRKYCSECGYNPMHKENFFRELRSTVANLREARPRIEGKRPRVIQGIVTSFQPEASA